MAELGKAGLLGLNAPVDCGGHGEGLLGLLVVMEALAKGCPATAMCMGMHCVATAVINAKATQDQKERFLKPIAEGRHITSLALSETGTGSHFYIPQTDVRLEDGHYIIDGEKQFVTNGRQADSYVISTKASQEDADAGEFNCLILEKDSPGLHWKDDWNGFGMRANLSCGLELKGARAPVSNLLGEEGDEIWYMFEVVAPYFLMAMSGVYLGIGERALELTMDHLRQRQHTHTHERLAEIPQLQHRIGILWAKLRAARLLAYSAAFQVDHGEPEESDLLASILSCKAEVADAVVMITNESMTLCGGIAYRENSELSRLLRDARASHVMAPSTDTLRIWTGRSLLGQPLL